MSIPGAIEMFQFTPFCTFHWFPDRRPRFHSFTLPLVFRLLKASQKHKPRHPFNALFGGSRIRTYNFQIMSLTSCHLLYPARDFYGVCSASPLAAEGSTGFV